MKFYLLVFLTIFCISASTYAGIVDASYEGDRFARTFIRASKEFARNFSENFYAEQAHYWAGLFNEFDKKYAFFKQDIRFLRAAIVRFKDKNITDAMRKEIPARNQLAIFFYLRDIMYSSALDDYVQLGGNNKLYDWPVKRVNLVPLNFNKEALEYAVKQAYGFTYQMGVDRLGESLRKLNKAMYSIK